MSAPAIISAAGRLRVAIEARDPIDRLGLAELVRNAGHEIVPSAQADVVVADGNGTAVDGAICIVLGGSGGAHAGHLPRDAGVAQIDAALRAVAAGLVVRVARDPAAGFGALPERKLHPLLTPREVEVLSAIAGGLGNKEIARRLDISLHTVKFHVESLFRKLGARSRAEAVAKGLARRRDETIVL